MSTLYTPDPAINSTFVVELSQRDLSLRVPINYVNHPGVVLRAACFSDRSYQELAAAKCISNLLVSGFRRLEADVYWDASRSVWSLCPVELGGAAEDRIAFSGVTTSTSVQKRQEGTLSQTSAAATTVTASTSMMTTATLAADPTTTSVVGTSQPPNSNIDGGAVIKAGSYSCTNSTDWTLLVNILSAHMASTDTDIAARTVTLMLNLHAAASASDPDGPAQAPGNDELPHNDTLLSAELARNATVYLYTPTTLLSQRANLNATGSWFSSYGASHPLTSYLEINQDGNTQSSPNGWPSESFVELPGVSSRLAVGFARIDPQMAAYNFSGDSATIFPPRYLESVANVTYTSDGNVATGCFFDPLETSIADANSSWAVATLGNGVNVSTGDASVYLRQARYLTACGISPILNATLGNISADQAFEPYFAFAQSTVWSWMTGQPVNTTRNTTSRADLSDFQCAALNSSSGRFLALDCGESHHGACRVGAEPYQWSISDAMVPYDRVELACDDNQEFDVPRTALENRYLLSAWRAYENGSDDDDVDELLWLNLNDLDTNSCWVVGENTTCPYSGSRAQRSRRIIVPVVGGVIVFVLTALTILVKCAGNRQTSKRRRRRGEDGWDYEGVPS